MESNYLLNKRKGQQEQYFSYCVGALLNVPIAQGQNRCLTKNRCLTTSLHGINLNGYIVTVTIHDRVKIWIYLYLAMMDVIHCIHHNFKISF